MGTASVCSIFSHMPTSFATVTHYAILGHYLYLVILVFCYLLSNKWEIGLIKSISSSIAFI